MANEISVNMGLVLTRASVDEQAWIVEPTTFSQTGSRSFKSVVNVGSTFGLLTIPTIGTYGWAMFKNNHTSSTLSLSLDGTASFMSLAAGESNLVKLGANVTSGLYAKMYSVSGNAEILILEL